MTPENERHSPEPKPFLTEKRWLLFVYVPVFTFVVSAVALVLGEHQGLARLFDIVMTLGLNICAFAWCRLDSTERKYPLSRLYRCGSGWDEMFGQFAFY